MENLSCASSSASGGGVDNQVRNRVAGTSAAAVRRVVLDSDSGSCGGDESTNDEEMDPGPDYHESHWRQGRSMDDAYACASSRERSSWFGDMQTASEADAIDVPFDTSCSWFSMKKLGFFRQKASRTEADVGDGDDEDDDEDEERVGDDGVPNKMFGFHRALAFNIPIEMLPDGANRLVDIACSGNGKHDGGATTAGRSSNSKIAMQQRADAVQQLFSLIHSHADGVLENGRHSQPHGSSEPLVGTVDNRSVTGKMATNAGNASSKFTPLDYTYNPQFEECASMRLETRQMFHYGLEFVLSPQKELKMIRMWKFVHDWKHSDSAGITYRIRSNARNLQSCQQSFNANRMSREDGRASYCDALSQPLRAHTSITDQSQYVGALNRYDVDRQFGLSQLTSSDVYGPIGHMSGARQARSLPLIAPERILNPFVTMDEERNAMRANACDAYGKPLSLWGAQLNPKLYTVSEDDDDAADLADVKPMRFCPPSGVEELMFILHPRCNRMIGALPFPPMPRSKLTPGEDVMKAFLSHVRETEHPLSSALRGCDATDTRVVEAFRAFSRGDSHMQTHDESFELHRRVPDTTVLKSSNTSSVNSESSHVPDQVSTAALNAMRACFRRVDNMLSEHAKGFTPANTQRKRVRLENGARAACEGDDGEPAEETPARAKLKVRKYEDLRRQYMRVKIAQVMDQFEQKPWMYSHGFVKRIRAGMDHVAELPGGSAVFADKNEMVSHASIFGSMIQQDNAWVTTALGVDTHNSPNFQTLWLASMEVGLLEARSIVCLTGPAGVGKSHMYEMLKRSIPDGCVVPAGSQSKLSGANGFNPHNGFVCFFDEKPDFLKDTCENKEKTKQMLSDRKLVHQRSVDKDGSGKFETETIITRHDQVSVVAMNGGTLCGTCKDAHLSKNASNSKDPDDPIMDRSVMLPLLRRDEARDEAVRGFRPETVLETVSGIKARNRVMTLDFLVMMQMLLAQSIDGYGPDLRCAQHQMALMDEELHHQFEIEPPDFRSSDRRLRMLKVLVYRTAACFVFGTKQYRSVFGDIACRDAIRDEAPTFDAEQLMYCSFMHFPTKEMIHYVWSLHLVQRHQPLHDMVVRGIIEHTGLFADALLHTADYTSPDVIGRPLAPLENPTADISEARRVSGMLRDRRLHTCHTSATGGENAFGATFQDVSVFYDTNTVRKTVKAVKRQNGRVYRNADARCMFVCDERTPSGDSIHNSKFITSYPSLCCSTVPQGYARVAKKLSENSRILRRRYVDADNVLDSIARLVHSRRVCVPPDQPGDMHKIRSSLRIGDSEEEDQHKNQYNEQFRGHDMMIDNTIFRYTHNATATAPGVRRFNTSPSGNASTDDEQEHAFEAEWKHAHSVGEFSIIEMPYRSLSKEKWVKEPALSIKKHIDETGTPHSVLSMSSVFAIRMCWLAAEARLASLSNPHMKLLDYKRPEEMHTYVDDNEKPCEGPAPDGMFLLTAYRAQQVSEATMWRDASTLPWVTPWPSHSGPKQLTTTMHNPCTDKPSYVDRRAAPAQSNSRTTTTEAALARDVACLSGTRHTRNEVREFRRCTTGEDTFDDKQGTCDPFPAAAVSFLKERGLLALQKNGTSFGAQILRELCSGEMAIAYDQERRSARVPIHTAPEDNRQLPFCVDQSQASSTTHTTSAVDEEAKSIDACEQLFAAQKDSSTPTLTTGFSWTQ